MLWVAPSITVAGTQHEFHQLPLSEADTGTTPFVTSGGKLCFKLVLFGIYSTLWLHQCMMQLARGNLGAASALVVTWMTYRTSVFAYV